MNAQLRLLSHSFNHSKTYGEMRAIIHFPKLHSQKWGKTEGNIKNSNIGRSIFFVSGAPVTALGNNWPVALAALSRLRVQHRERHCSLQSAVVVAVTSTKVDFFGAQLTFPHNPHAHEAFREGPFLLPPKVMYLRCVSSLLDTHTHMGRVGRSARENFSQRQVEKDEGTAATLAIPFVASCK